MNFWLHTVAQAVSTMKKVIVRLAYSFINFSVEFKIGNKQNIANPGEVSAEELNEPEKAGNIKTVFKQLFKCAFYFNLS